MSNELRERNEKIFTEIADRITKYFNNEIIYGKTIRTRGTCESLNTYKTIQFKVIQKPKLSSLEKKRPEIRNSRRVFFIDYNTLNNSFVANLSLYPNLKEIKQEIFALVSKNRYIKTIQENKEKIIVKIIFNDEAGKIQFSQDDVELAYLYNKIKIIIKDYIFRYNESKEKCSFQLCVLLYLLLLDIYSIKLNKIFFLGKILKIINIKEIDELLLTSFNYQFHQYSPFFSSSENSTSIFFISQVKDYNSKYSTNKKKLISLVKSLEYKEYFSRIIQKINKIDDIKLKTEADEALFIIKREVCLHKIKKQVSLLKMLFLQIMKRHPFVAKDIIEYANKYTVFFYHSYKVLPGAYQQAILTTFSKERPIPNYIKAFDSLEPHTIPIDQYLDERLSRTIRLLISKVNQHGRNTEIFIGSEDQMMCFYTYFGYGRIACLKTDSSLHYYLFSKEEDPKLNKIVILGVGNETKLNHLLLQLKLGNVDLDKIIIRGSLEDTLHENQQKLNAIIEDLVEEIDTVFMGNRSLILIEFAKRKYPKEMRGTSNKIEAEKIAEKLLKTHHNLKTYEIGDGIYKFSCFELRIRNKNVEIICFRMPNGSLARIATEALIRKGVHHFVMLGAGGSLSSMSSIGSYHLIKSTIYNNNPIHLSELHLKEMKVDLSGIPLFENGNNVTLDSPLSETRSWLTQMRNTNFTSVDVETYHIIKGIQNYEKYSNKIEVLPGIFISDIVGDCPLTEKIKSRNTWAYLPQFLNICFEYIEKKIKDALINADTGCSIKDNKEPKFAAFNELDNPSFEANKRVQRKQVQTRLNSL